MAGSYHDWPDEKRLNIQQSSKNQAWEETTDLRSAQDGKFNAFDLLAVGNE